MSKPIDLNTQLGFCAQLHDCILKWILLKVQAISVKIIYLKSIHTMYHGNFQNTVSDPGLSK